MLSENNDLKVFCQIETDSEGEIIDMHCTCNNELPCIHIMAMLMGLALMDATETDNIDEAKSEMKRNSKAE